MKWMICSNIAFGRTIVSVSWSIKTLDTTLSLANTASNIVQLSASHIVMMTVIGLSLFVLGPPSPISFHDFFCLPVILYRFFLHFFIRAWAVLEKMPPSFLAKLKIQVRHLFIFLSFPPCVASFFLPALLYDVNCFWLLRKLL